jgi:hypothetical protein
MEDLVLGETAFALGHEIFHSLMRKTAVSGALQAELSSVVGEYFSDLDVIAR